MKEKNVINTIRNLAFFITLIALTFYFIFKDQNMKELFNIIHNANYIYIFLGIISMLAYFTMESINIKSLLNALGEKLSFLKAFKYTMICYFFSGITPGATGGQPMEVYYMKKEHISATKSTLTLLIQVCSILISTLSISIISVLIKPSILKDNLIWLFILGLIVNAMALSFMSICVFSKKLTDKMANLLIKLLTKIKINKIDKIKDKIDKTLEKYNESRIFIKTHKKEFIKSIMRCFIQTIFYYLVPFFVFKALGLSGYNPIQIIMIQAVLYSTTYGIPLPGAVGISEAVYLTLYLPVFHENLIYSAMLLSRGINFYLFIIISCIITILNLIHLLKKKKDNENKIK